MEECRSAVGLGFLCPTLPGVEFARCGEDGWVGCEVIGSAEIAFVD